ncbi:MAG: hypothetical protein Q7L55_09980 [Actinomycetota bacterium]|nr:hypothetical protein [Actinomycetota bacterium]
MDALVWGQAQDGVLARIEIFNGGADSLESIWPLIGLQRAASVDESADVPEAEFHWAVDASEPVSMSMLESEFALFAAEHLSSGVAIHAALLEHLGRVLLLPGPSFIGKSSLAAAADAAGWNVLSDEYAVVDPLSYLVYGWPRHIKLREGQGWIRGASARAHEPHGVDLIAFLNFSSDDLIAGATALTVRHFEPGEAAMELLANTVCAQRRPKDSFIVASALARTTPAISGVRGEADRAIQSLAQLLAAAIGLT